MGRNNSGGGGCLTWVVVGAVVIGNLLLFTGSLSGDLADNSIAWILAIVAVIADIALICFGISSAAKRREQRSLEQEVNTRSMPAQAAPRQSQQPTAPAQSDNSKLGQLMTKYAVPAAPVIPTTVDPLQKDMESYQSLAVLQTVNRIINLRRDLIKELIEKKKGIDYLLSCPGCTSDREKIKFLNANEKELSQKKNEYLDILNRINSKKVTFLAKESQTFSQIRGIFSEIAASQKIIGEAGVAYKDCVRLNSSLPGDLFESKQNPIELNFGTYRFFMLPDVVLAYNNSGEFVTAFEPMALIIRIEDKRKNVYASNMGGRGWSYRDNVIASDSSLVSQGNVRTGWLHEKKSGGPDLRYSFANNPRYDSRTDTYSYTEVSIQIGHYKAVYSASKGALAAKAKPSIRNYCAIAHKLNVVPSLLRLLESTSKKQELAKELYVEYVRDCKDIICKEA